MTHLKPEYEAMLGSRSAAARLQAVRELARDARDGGDACLPLLLRALGDRSNLVIAEAAKGLRPMAEKAGPDVIAALIERYWWLAGDGQKRDPGCLARWEIISALAFLRAREASSVFFDAIRTTQVERSGVGLEDTAVRLRGQAASALAELHVPGALLALSVLLFDTVPRVPVVPEERLFVTMPARCTAARALASLGDPGGVAALGIRLVHPLDEVPEVLVECMDAMASLDADAALDTIPPYLEKDDPYLVGGAATCLASLPASYHDSVLTMLREACKNAATATREAVALAIASMRSDKAVSALEELTRHDTLSVRLAAVAALVERGCPKSAEVLRKVGEGHVGEEPDDPRVLEAARRELAELGRS